MKNVLAGEGLQAVARLARSKALLAFDYDGTLAPIVKDPSRARMRHATRVLLERAARLYPCVVISGRRRKELLSLLRGSGVRHVVGNHGLETGRRRSGALAKQVRSWVPALRRELAAVPGVLVEDKVLSVAVHYRLSPSSRRARDKILRAASRFALRVVGGKRVVNLLPLGDRHKGSALEAARRQFGCRVALYVGDDETDEDVFRLGNSSRLLTVRVQRKSTSGAAYFVRDQRRIDGLLAQLVALHTPPPPAAPAGRRFPRRSLRPVIGSGRRTATTRMSPPSPSAT